MVETYRLGYLWLTFPLSSLSEEEWGTYRNTGRVPTTYDPSKDKALTWQANVSKGKSQVDELNVFKEGSMIRINKRSFIPSCRRSKQFVLHHLHINYKKYQTSFCLIKCRYVMHVAKIKQGKGWKVNLNEGRKEGRKRKEGRDEGRKEWTNETLEL